MSNNNNNNNRNNAKTVTLSDLKKIDESNDSSSKDNETLTTPTSGTTDTVDGSTTTTITEQNKQDSDDQNKSDNEATKSADLRRVEFLIEDYLKSNTGFIDDSNRNIIIRKFNKIVEHTLNSKENAVFNKVFRFFKDNSNKILVPELALQGISTFHIATRTKVETFYSLFSKLNSDSPTMDVDYLKTIFDNDKFVQFVTQKMSVMSEK